MYVRVSTMHGRAPDPIHMQCMASGPPNKGSRVTRLEPKDDVLGPKRAAQRAEQQVPAGSEFAASSLEVLQATEDPGGEQHPAFVEQLVALPDQAPLVEGKRLKLRYVTQAKARPPTFIIFGTRVEMTPEDYQRYLVNSLRETFSLPGTPVRLQFRGSKNPYADQD